MSLVWRGPGFYHGSTTRKATALPLNHCCYSFCNIVPCKVQLNWWKGKPSGSIACTRKQQPRFYWSCSSVVMNDATPLTPPSLLIRGSGFPLGPVNFLCDHYHMPLLTFWASCFSQLAPVWMQYVAGGVRRVDESLVKTGVQARWTGIRDTYVAC